MDPDLDCSSGNPVLKDSVKCVENMMISYDLVDIWRIRKAKNFLGDKKAQLFKDALIIGSLVIRYKMM